MNKYLNISRLEILDLISCARDYGFENDVLFSSFASWLVKITDGEIDEYCIKYLPSPTYEEDDINNAKDRIKYFIERYLSNNGTKNI